jgi:hypothetical protein
MWSPVPRDRVAATLAAKRQCADSGTAHFAWEVIHLLPRHFRFSRIAEGRGTLLEPGT